MTATFFCLLFLQKYFTENTFFLQTQSKKTKKEREDVKRHRCMPDIWGVLDKMYCQKERA